MDPATLATIIGLALKWGPTAYGLWKQYSPEIMLAAHGMQPLVHKIASGLGHDVEEIAVNDGHHAIATGDVFKILAGRRWTDGERNAWFARQNATV